MSYLLLTSKEPEVAHLLNLDLYPDRLSLSGMFEAVAHGQDSPWDGLYAIVDGVPTPCTTEGSPTPPKFDEDDYADVQVTIRTKGDSPIVVHQFGYRIDGRS